MPRPIRGAAPSRVPAATDGDEAPRLVPAVERAVRLIDHLAERDRAIGLAELSRALQVPKSSLHGLLLTLTTLGVLVRTPDGGHALGPRVLQWAGGLGSPSALIQAFQALSLQQPSLRREALMLAVLDGDDVVYLACQPGNTPLAVNFRVGGRLPACCTSSGKAMLATLPDEQVIAMMGHGGLRRLTPHSVDSIDALLDQLRRIREQGYAIDDEETAEGMHCFAAAIHHAGQPAWASAAVATSLIKATVTPERAADVAQAIQALARQISARLGMPGPT
ncbi:MAG: IclR family transcriptional regulator [Burkholderiaceae bacterium]